jgi:CHAT domain-containing protein
LYDIQKRYDEAEKTLDRAYQILSQALPENHYWIGNVFHAKGRLCHHEGKKDQSLVSFNKALEILSKKLGEKHPRYAKALSDLASLYRDMGNYDRAESLYGRALAITRDNLDLAAAIQSERQQLAMTEDLRQVLDDCLSLDAEGKRPAERLYEQTLIWKGAVSLRQRNQRLARRHPELAKDFAELDRAASRLAALALSAPDPKRLDAHRRQMQELTEDKERQEARLARRSADFRREKERRRLTLAQLQAALPADAALLDFLEYAHSTPPAENKGPWIRERRLVAFVVRKDSLMRVDLGPAEPIQGVIERWRPALQRRFRANGDDDLGTAVRRLVWQPVEKHLRGAKLVLVSPDGALARVPFAALPGAKEGSYLLEELAVAAAPVPQLLSELLAATRDEGEPEPSVLLVGEVDYGASPGAAVEVASSRSAARRGALAAFVPLDQTRVEVLAVRDSFEERFPDGRVKVLRKARATEAEVRRQAPKHRYLHFATHGFFAPKELRSALAAASRAEGSEAVDLFGRQGVAGFHPGLLSGLVLAGANRPVDPAKDDGILTALEVEALDLTGVELATLSACETGLGEAAGGEGLLGLQRAFQVAGARSVMAGLWQVDDKATRDLMTRFYENLWNHKLPKLEALRQAQLWMLKEGAKRGMIDPKVPRERLAKEDGRLPPYYWAAFALSGDWR